MKTNGVKIGVILPALLLAVLTCFTNAAGADSNQYYSNSSKTGYDPITIAFGVFAVNGTSTINTVTFYYVNGSSANKAFSVSSTSEASPSQTYYVKNGTWKVELKNTYFNQKLNTYINIGNGTWGYAEGCNSASTDPNCSAGHLMPPLPASPPQGGPNLTPGCQMNRYSAPPTPSGIPSPYWSMSEQTGFTGITMALGACSVNGTQSTITASYSVKTGADTEYQFSVNNKDPRSMIVYMKQDALWKVDVANSYFNQNRTAYFKVTSSGWEYANNCNSSSQNQECSAAELLSPTSTTPPTINAGCQETRYTPPPPPQLVCGNNTQTTDWDDNRITITNNCADDAYIVLTPPNANATYQQYNRELWKMAAARRQMDTMYANPNDLTSALMFRKKLESGTNMTIPVPEGGIASGNIGVLLKCQTDPTGIGWPGNCTIGPVPGTASTGVGTILEYSAGCTYTSETDRKTKCTVNPSSNEEYCLGSSDYYDLSMVNGYSVPMHASVANGTAHECNVTEINGVTDLYDCPNETNATISATGENVQSYNNPQLAQASGIGLYISNDPGGNDRAACITPAQWLNAGGQNPKNKQLVALSGNPVALNELNIADWYGCNGIPPNQDPGDPASCFGPGCGGPQCAVGPDGQVGIYNEPNLVKGKGIPYTNYVKYLKAIGVDGYAWQFNDDASTVLCKKAGVAVHLTLCPGKEGQEPYNSQQSWTFEDKKCQALPPGSSGTYTTLLDCMKDNYWYSCQQEEVKKLGPNSSVVSAKLNYCKPYKPKNDQSAGSDGTPLQTYEQCIKYETQCQTYGPEQ
ncbi:hypothetical protein [Maridesulfovibrio sp.]|uniref:hypothetical protein n=1 Tax=Maridesulfovibrio sp. TaxID=2795000 RepID=UPI0039EDF780